MSAGDSILVVGGDGLVGRATRRGLAARGLNVLHTSRRSGGGEDGALVLDLAADPATWPDLSPVNAAVLCAAVARLDRCEADPEGSRRINVSATVELALRLVARGAYVLFLSSDKVFDGLAPRRIRDDKPSPRTAYGRQKAEAERLILGLGAGTAVLRLTKVLAPELALIRSWRAELSAGCPIAPFRNMFLAPVSVSRVVETISALLHARAGGIYHASGVEDVSYVAFATSLADAIGADRALVAPVTVDAAVVPAAFRPPFSSLEMTVEARRFALPAESASEAVARTISIKLNDI